MTKTVEFFYDYASPYSYLADCQLPQIAANHRATIIYRPAILGVLVVESGNQPPPTVPAKTEIPERRHTPLGGPSERLLRPESGVPRPQHHADARRAGRAGQRCLSRISRGHVARDVDEQANLADPAVIGDTLTRAGLDAQTIMRGTADDAVKARLKANCDDALARGAFGMPTFFVGDEMFFGNDRSGFCRSRARARLDHVANGAVRPSVRHDDVVAASASKSGRGRASNGSRGKPLLQRVRDAQQLAVFVHRADDLNAERRAGLVEPARQRDDRVANDGDRRRQREPRHVVVDRRAVDRARIQVGPRKR